MSNVNPPDPHSLLPFDGQVEKLIFTLDHVKALASPVRALVFWCFSATEPKSVSDIAAEIGKSSQTVRYHVNALTELDLIISVDERKRRSRTELLYVRKAILSLDSGAEGTPEYNRYRARGLALECRKMTREAENYYKILERERSVISYSLIRKAHVRLSREQAAKLRVDIVNLYAEAAKNQTPAEEGGMQVNLVMYMFPTTFQSRTWAAELGFDLGTDGDGDDDGDEES